MIFIIFITNIPQVSFDTAQFMGQVQVVHAIGMVCHGTGTVWENPTRGLPILNPNCISVKQNCKECWKIVAPSGAK